MFDLNNVQQYMRENHIDSWVICDFRGSNPILWQLFGERKSTTRKTFLIIPSVGEPCILTHIVDKDQFNQMPFHLRSYIGWADMQADIKDLLFDNKIVAMEYSHNGSIPTISWVDGGTIDFIRSLGIQIVSSADLFQITAAIWNVNALKSHLMAAKELGEIKSLVFSYIKESCWTEVPLGEYDVQEFIMREFEIRGLETEDRPVVAVNANSSDPHYEPMAQVDSKIKVGDWILVDLWARYPGEHNIFADITWVGYLGDRIPLKYRKIFKIVKEARNLVVDRLKSSFQNGEQVEGWQLDRVARDHIDEAGYGKYFVHRTGHSLGPGSSLHALGVNLDDLETHDNRKILIGNGFSVEPGIYLSDFGVRSEINVYMSAKGPIITTPIQEGILSLA